MAQAPSKTDLTPRLQTLLGIPYGVDAVQDERGRWTTFTHPDKELSAPGLNCSGFVLAAACKLLGRTLSPEQATVDRQSNSGKNAALGQDWDFGWDLVMNLSEGFPRRALLPEGHVRVEGTDGLTQRGFSMSNDTAWTKIMPRIMEGRVYLASISRKAKGSAKKIQHYHTALLLRDGKGRVWFYQTMPRGRSHRLNLSIDEGRQTLHRMFGEGKWILILEVEMR
jgi:hypothetical protein